MGRWLGWIFAAYISVLSPANAEEICNASLRAPAPATCYFVRERSDPLYQQLLRKLGISDNGAYRIAILAGVSEYKDTRIGSLVWAHRDLVKLFNTLRDQHLFDEIIGSENAHFSIQNLNVWLNGPVSDRIRSRNGVQFLFAFSGHGIPRTLGSRPASGMLLVRDFEQRSHRKRCHFIRTLIVTLTRVAQSFQSLILINSCFSGNMLPQSFGDELYDRDRPGAHVITAEIRRIDLPNFERG